MGLPVALPVYPSVCAFGLFAGPWLVALGGVSVLGGGELVGLQALEVSHAGCEEVSELRQGELVVQTLAS